jgi:hypothetical protein
MDYNPDSLLPLNMGDTREVFSRFFLDDEHDDEKDVLFSGNALGQYTPRVHLSAPSSPGYNIFFGADDEPLGSHELDMEGWGMFEEHENAPEDSSALDDSFRRDVFSDFMQYTRHGPMRIVYQDGAYRIINGSEQACSTRGNYDFLEADRKRARCARASRQNSLARQRAMREWSHALSVAMADSRSGGATAAKALEPEGRRTKTSISAAAAIQAPVKNASNMRQLIGGCPCPCGCKNTETPKAAYRKDLTSKKYVCNTCGLNQFRRIKDCWHKQPETVKNAM